MRSLVLLISGDLGLSVLDLLLKNKKLFINAVFTNTDSSEIIRKCESLKILCFVGNPRKDNRALKFIQEHSINIDLLLSINYLFLLDDSILSLKWKYTVNFHGALLPKYRGRTPHIWAIINGEKETGVTAHVINNACDEGDIILQKRISINVNDTGGDILLKFMGLYPPMVNEVLDRILSNEISFLPQDHSQASYYGKRAPDDGEIMWSWFKYRIYDWVRAQAFPYPGAFTYYNGVKIIIDRVKIVSCSYSGEQENGLILRGGCNPCIKVPDGVLELEVIRDSVDFIEGNTLGK